GVEVVSLTGTAGDDTLHLYKAGDTFVGGAGRDKLVDLDLSDQTAGATLVFNEAGGVLPLPGGGNLNRIERIAGNVLLGSGNDSAKLEYARMDINSTVNLDGGLGTDTLNLGFSGLTGSIQAFNTGTLFDIDEYNGGGSFCG